MALRWGAEERRSAAISPPVPPRFASGGAIRMLFNRTVFAARPRGGERVLEHEVHGKRAHPMSAPSPAQLAPLRGVNRSQGPRGHLVGARRGRRAARGGRLRARRRSDGPRLVGMLPTLNAFLNAHQRHVLVFAYRAVHRAQACAARASC